MWVCDRLDDVFVLLFGNVLFDGVYVIVLEIYRGFGGVKKSVGIEEKEVLM